MADIENKIVKLQFDNGGVVKTAKETAEAMDELNESLELKDASDGINNTQAALDQLSTEEPQKQVQSLQEKFNVLETAVKTIVFKITGNLVDSFTSAVSSVTSQLSEISGMEAAAEGWSKYESTVSSTQTIMNATGKSIEEVEDALAELQWYSDETSYSYSDMTDNVGKFTSAGIELDDAVQAMEGISNWAALAGANSSEAARAYYQLSQALGTGYIQQIDWKSIETLNMSTEEFKQSVIDTAIEMGTLKETADGLYYAVGNENDTFTTLGMRDYLKDQWLTTDVLMATLEDYSDYTREVYQLTEEEGLTASEAMEQLGGDVEDIGVKALKAAQEAKTFTDVIDALKDAASSGWSKTFTLIVGNYEEAKELWTDVVNALWDLVLGGHDEMNDMLKEWNNLGGRDDLLEGLYNICGSLLDIIWAIKDAWREIFPRSTGDEIYNLTKSFKKFSENLVVSQKTIKKLQTSFEGLFAVLNIFKNILIGITKIATSAFKALLPDLEFERTSKGILDLTSAIGNYILSINDMIEKTKLFDDAADLVYDSIVKFKEAAKDFVLDNFSAAIDLITEKYREFKNTLESITAEDIENGLNKAVDVLESVYSDVIDICQKIKEIAITVKDWVMTYIVEPIKGIAQKIWPYIKPFVMYLKDIFSGIADSLKEGDLDSALDQIKKVVEIVSMIFIVKKVVDIGAGIYSAIKGLKKSITGFGDIITSLNDVVKAVKTSILLESISKIGLCVIEIAVAIALLGAMDTKTSWRAWTQIILIIASLLAVTKIAAKAGGSGILAFSLLGISIGVIVGTMLLLSQLDTQTIGDGLAALLMIEVVLSVLVIMAGIAVKIAGGDKAWKSLAALSVVIVAVSYAIKKLIPYFIVLSNIPLDSMTNATMALFAISGAIALLMVAILTFSTSIAKVGKGSTKTLAGVVVILWSIASIIEQLMFVVGVIAVADMSENLDISGAISKLSSVMSMLGALIVITLGLVAIAATVNSSALSKVVWILVVLEIIIGTIGGFTIAFASIDKSALESATAAIRTLVGMTSVLISLALVLTILLVIISKSTNVSSNDISALTLILGSVLLLVNRLGNFAISFSSVDPSSLQNALSGIETIVTQINKLVITFALLALVIGYADKTIGTVDILSTMERITDMMKGLLPVITVLGVFILALSSGYLSDTSAAIGGTIALILLIGTIAGILIAISYISMPKNYEDRLKMFIDGMASLTGIAISLMACVAILSLVGGAVGSGNVLVAALSLLLLITAFSLILATIATTKGTDKRRIESFTNGVTALSKALLPISIALAILSACGTGSGSILVSAIALVAIIGVFSLLLLAISKSKTFKASKLASFGSIMLALSAALIPIAAALVILSSFGGDTSSLIVSALALTAIILVLVGVVYLLNGIQISPTVLISAGVLLLLAGVLLAITGVLVVLAQTDLSSIASKLLTLGAVLGALIIAVALLGIIGTAIPGLSAGIMAFAEVIGVVVIAAVLIAAVAKLLSSAFKDIADAIDTLVGLSDRSDQLSSVFTDLADGIIDGMETLIEGIPDLIEALVSAFEDVCTGDYPRRIAAAIGDFLISAVESLGEMSSAIVEAVGKLILTSLGPIGDWIEENSGDLATKIGDAVGGIVVAGVKSIPKLGRAIGDAVVNAIDISGTNEYFEGLDEEREEYYNHLEELSKYAPDTNAQILDSIKDSNSSANKEFKAWCEENEKEYSDEALLMAYNCYTQLKEAGETMDGGFEEFLSRFSAYDDIAEYTENRMSELTLRLETAATYHADDTRTDDENLIYYKKKYQEDAAKQGKTLKEYMNEMEGYLEYTYEELANVSTSAAESAADESAEETEDSLSSSMSGLLSGVLDSVSLGGDASGITDTLSSVTSSLTDSFSGLNDIDLSSLTDQFSSFDSLGDIDLSSLTGDLSSMSEIDMSSMTDSFSGFEDMDLSGMSMDISGVSDSTSSLTDSLSGLDELDLSSMSTDLSSISSSTDSLTSSVSSANEDGSLEITPSISTTAYNEDYQAFIQTLGDLVEKIDTMEADGDFTITPVMDMSDITANMTYLENNGLASVFKAPTSTVTLDISLKTVESKLQAITEEISNLRSDVQTISNMQIVLDSGAIAGATTNKINSNLGKKSVFASRGVLY